MKKPNCKKVVKMYYDLYSKICKLESDMSLKENDMISDLCQISSRYSTLNSSITELLTDTGSLLQTIDLLGDIDTIDVISDTFKYVYNSIKFCSGNIMLMSSVPFKRSKFKRASIYDNNNEYFASKVFYTVKYTISELRSILTDIGADIDTLKSNNKVIKKNKISQADQCIIDRAKHIRECVRVNADLSIIEANVNDMIWKIRGRIYVVHNVETSDILKIRYAHVVILSDHMHDTVISAKSNMDMLKLIRNDAKQIIKTLHGKYDKILTCRCELITDLKEIDTTDDKNNTNCNVKDAD